MGCLFYMQKSELFGQLSLGPPGPAPFDVDEFFNGDSTLPATTYTNWIKGNWNASVRKYDNGRVVIRLFSERHGIHTPLKNPDSEPSTEEEKLITAVSRARSVIFDLALGNSWTYFITLTFDRQKVGDRYDYENVCKHMKTFTQYLFRHGCQWLMIPEYHKDKAYHFHGLVQGELGMQFREKKRGINFYSIAGYHKGRSDISYIRDQGRVSSYITKYITKDGLSCVPQNAKKYWASRGLSRPDKKRAYIALNDVSSLVQQATYQSTSRNPLDDEIITLIF